MSYSISPYPGPFGRERGNRCGAEWTDEGDRVAGVRTQKLTRGTEEDPIRGERSFLPVLLANQRRGQNMTGQNLCVQAQRWYRELGVSEVRREEAEKRAGKAANEVKRAVQAANEVKRVVQAANEVGMREETKEVEEMKRENHTLRAEVWIEKVSLSLTTIVMS